MRVEWVAIMLALGTAAVPVLADARDADAGGSVPGAAESAARKSRESAVLEEIVVTATKREESVQKLPEAVTAITSADLDNLNAQSFEEYFRTVPGLMMNSAGGGSRPFDFSLRGISDFSDLSPQQTSATVGQYLDEIPVTAAGQQVDPRLIDVERIEVLRGPQGTYFGEDSLGGTIRVITKKPDLNNVSGSAEARISNTNHGGMNNSESGMINLPLWDQKLGMRLSGFGAYDSGFIDSFNTHCDAASCAITGVQQRNINPGTAAGGRAMLLFKPVDRLSVLGEYIHTDSVSHDTAFYEPKVGDLAIAASEVTNQVVKDHNNLSNITATAELGWAQVVSASSWGRRDSTVYQGPPDFSLFSFDTFAQELRLVGTPDKSSRWDYVAGLYYSRESQGIEILAAGFGGAAGAQVIDEHFKEKAVFGEMGFKFTGRLSARLGLRTQQVDYDNSQGTGAGGGRPPPASGRNTPTTGRVITSYEFTDDAMAYASVSRGFRKGGLNLSYYNSFTGQPNPNIPLSYKPDTTTNYELGWKLSFPSARATLNAAVYHIDWSDIQVIGLAPVPGAPGSNPTQYYHNAGAAKVDGFELEGGLQLLEGLRAQLSFSVMNPVMTRNQELAQDDPASGYYAPAYCQRGCPAREGDQIPFVSKLSGSLTLNYRRALTNGGLDGFAVLSEQYVGPRNTDFASSWEGPSQTPVFGCPVMVFGPCPVPLQPVPRTVNGRPNSAFVTMRGYTLTNIQLGIENAHWRLSLYADNLFDTRAQTVIAPGTFPGGGGDEVLVQRPRTFGAWARYSF